MSNTQSKEQKNQETREKGKVSEKKKETKEKSSPEIKPGMTVRIHQKLKEKDKERIQIFEGIVIAKKGKKEAGATFTVRKISHGVGVEKIFPLFSPVIAKIEAVKQAKTRRAKLYFLRDYKKRLKETKIS